MDRRTKLLKLRDLYVSNRAGVRPSGKNYLYVVAKYGRDPHVLSEFVDLFDYELLASNKHAIHILGDEKYLKQHEHNEDFRRALSNNSAAVPIFASGRLPLDLYLYSNTNREMIPVLLKSKDLATYVISLIDWFARYYDIRRIERSHKNNIRYDDPYLVAVIVKLITIQKSKLYIHGKITNFHVFDNLWIGRIKELTPGAIRSIYIHCRRTEVIDLVKKVHPDTLMIPMVSKEYRPDLKRRRVINKYVGSKRHYDDLLNPMSKL
jgi:hypothetical protein